MKESLKKSFFELLKKFGYELKSIKKKDDSDEYRKIFSSDSVDNKRFYNVSAGGHARYGGGFEHPCWRNLDVLKPDNPEWNVSFNPDKDIEYDLMEMQPLPFESNTAEIIQCQYSIEHLTNEAVDYFFREAYRVLKPGGVFKVVAPNVDLDYLSYKNRDKSYFFWTEYMSKSDIYPMLGYKIPLNKASFEQVVLAHFAGNASTIHECDNPNQISDEEFQHVMSTMPKEEALEYCTSRCSFEVQKKYRYNHINWWNHKKLISRLKGAGFQEANIMAPLQSSISVMRNRDYFDNLWNEVAMFVEVRKAYM